MELEIIFKDPENKEHHTIVKTGVELLTPEKINSMIFRGGRNVIFTKECPYNGTEIKTHSFRIRSLNTRAKKMADFYWTIEKKYGNWSQWYNYNKFFDESFPEEVVTRTITKVITIKPRRHS